MQAMDNEKGFERNVCRWIKTHSTIKKVFYRRKPGCHFKALHLLWVFFPPGRWRAKEIMTWEKGREETSTPVVEPGAPPPFSDHNPSKPQGKVWQRERDKGRRERERKEEIVGEIYRPLQQLTEGWVNLLLIAYAHKTNWTDSGGRLREASKGGCGLPTTTYLPWWHGTISVCLLWECKQQQWRSAL